MAAERILVLGCSGSGKSTLTCALARATALPIVHLDRHYWRAGWKEPSKTEWKARIATLIAEPRWIMDGTYHGTLLLRLQRTDAVVFLDMPTALCMARVLRRIMMYHGRVRGEDLPEGCIERFDLPFLRYVVRFRRDTRPKVLAALSGFPGDIVTLGSRRDAHSFIAKFRNPS